MAISHFEKLIQDAMTEVTNALLRTDPRDPVAVAKLQSRYATLSDAKDFYRQASRTDADPEGDGI